MSIARYLILVPLAIIGVILAAPWWLSGAAIAVIPAGLVIWWDGMRTIVQVAATATGDMSNTTKTTGGQSKFHAWLRVQVELYGSESKAADALAVDRQCVNAWLRGRDPSYAMLVRIAEQAKVPVQNWF